MLKSTVLFYIAGLIASAAGAQSAPSVLLDFSQFDGRTVSDQTDPAGAPAVSIHYGTAIECGNTRVLSLDGYLTHLELEKTRGLKFEQGITIAAWICPLKTQANTVVIGRPNPNPDWTTPSIGLYFPSAGKLGMGLWTPKKCKFEADAEIVPGRWIFAACTWDRRTAKIYINGALKGEMPCAGPLPEFNAPFGIGCGSRNNPFFRGLLGEVRIYPQALPGDDIEALFRKSRSLYPEKLLPEKQHGIIMVRSRKNEKNDWQLFESRTLRSLEDFNPVRGKTKLSKYGGWENQRTSATGFFRTEKINGRWWLIDPEGWRFIHVGVGSVSIGNSPKSLRACDKNYGDRQLWAQSTVNLLRSNNFNGIGNWSDFDYLRAATNPLPYTVRGGFLSGFARLNGLVRPAVGHSGYAGDVPPIFAPGFKEFCAQEAAGLAKYKDDPYLLGVFSDNEIIPADLNKFLALDRNDPLLKPSYDAAFEWLRKRRGADTASVSSVTRLENMEFGAYAFDHYYRIVSTALKKHLPNHLYLGSRLHGPCYRNPLIVTACGKYADIISINYYGSWNPDDIRYWEKISGRPMMITEFYTKGEDSGLPNTTGAGWIVPTQADRGWFYQNFVLGLLESRGCVGWHWFKYMDNDPDNKKADPSNLDSNKGIVTVDFQPYPELLNAMKEINNEVYPLTEYFDRK